MNLGELEDWGRAEVPGAKINRISQVLMRSILNQGAKEIARKVKCLYKVQDFATVASASEYDLSSVVTRYLTPAKEGLWWKNGSTWEQLEPVSGQYMKLRHPNHYNDGDGALQRYWIEEHRLFTHLKAESAVSDSLRLHFYQAPPTMTADAHFPFGGTTEITRLVPLHTTLLLYWKWKAYHILEKTQEAGIALQEYMADLRDKKRDLKDRPDVRAGDYTYLTKMGKGRVA